MLGAVKGALRRPFGPPLTAPARDAPGIVPPRRARWRNHKETAMLRIYAVVLDWLGDLPPVLAQVARGDRHLADQLRRSATSVALNLCEGMGATGGNKTRAYRVALQEMREAIGARKIAERMGYLPRLDTATADRQDHIVATLVRLARPQG
jgi:four helix bundle protein